MRFLPALCTTGFIFSAACSSHAPQAASTAAAIHIAAVRAIKRDLREQTVLSAELRPYQEVEVHAKVAGYVKRMLVDVGDHVSSGQLLATLEIPEMVSDLSRAQAGSLRSQSEIARARDEVNRAKAAYDAAHLTFTRLRDVAKQRPNLIAQQEIDQAEARDQIENNSLGGARSALESAVQLAAGAHADEQRTVTMNAYARITAPFAGVISKRYADNGAMIQAGIASQSQAMPLVRVSEIDRLRLIVHVPEALAANAHPGAVVTVRVPSAHKTFEGRIARISSRLDEQTRTMETEIDVVNKGSALVPGMYAEAVFMIAERTGALSIPIAAVVSGNSVFAVRDGLAVKASVTTGLTTADYVEITAGLHAGDVVAISSLDALRDGSRVTARIDSSEEAR